MLTEYCWCEREVGWYDDLAEAEAMVNAWMTMRCTCVGARSEVSADTASFREIWFLYVRFVSELKLT